MAENNTTVMPARFDTQFSSYPEMFKSLATQYSGLPMDNILSAFARTSGGAAFAANPFIQNRRVKEISSLPKEYSYDKVSEMIQSPDSNELPLREISHSLEATASPYFKIRKTYQDILTYHWYTFPEELEESEAKTKELLREMRLTEKIALAAGIDRMAHQIVGQCVQEGKVFYTFRGSVDKAHNKVNYAYMQQLPQNWTKIVGQNNISKYTVAFDMMYFSRPGTNYLQFGDLFEPYMDDFMSVYSEIPMRDKKKFVYASNKKGALEYIRHNASILPGTPDVYYQGGRWYYWVTLPIDRVWSFEIDDVSRNVAPPLTGLFLSMTNIAKYEQVQLSLVQNPLVAMVLGEIPYRDDTRATAEDAYKLSPSGRRLFEQYWYQMLAANNTTGVGLYLAPADNLHLEQLAEAPSATKISSDGYAYAMQKSGIGIIPATTDPRAGTVQVSMQIECRFASIIYEQIERMMNYIYSSLNLKWSWRFHMFGSLADDEQRMKEAKDGMTLGILPCTLEYLAMIGRRLTDDLAISNLVLGLGLMDKRLPLVSTYSAKQEKSGLPPQAGRPREDNIATEGKEKDLDAGK